MNIITTPKTSAYSYAPRPGDTSPFYTQPLYLPGELQTFRGPFNGKASDTYIDVNGKPGLIVAETPRSLYWMLPEGTVSGSVTVTLREGPNGFTFQVFVLGLAMSADRLHLLRGESTRMNATVFGPELLPESAWRAGEISDVMDPAKVRELFPNFKIPKPGEPATLFFRLDNASRETVSMSPSKNESFVTELGRPSFSGGPYRYDGTIQSKKTGNFTINGIVVAFFDLMAGKPLPTDVATGGPTIAQPPTSGVTTTPGTTTRPCQKTTNECEELRRRAEQLEAEVAALEATHRDAAQQVYRNQEAAYLDDSAARDRAYAQGLRQRAQAWRDLARDALTDAERNLERAKKWPPGHPYRKEWEDEAARDRQRAEDRNAEANRLEEEAKRIEDAAKQKSDQANNLKSPVDPAVAAELDAKRKAAAEARAAYLACLGRLSEECARQDAVGTTTGGESGGTVGGTGQSTTGSGPGGTTTGVPTGGQTVVRPPPQVSAPLTSGQPPASQTTDEVKCGIRAINGWFAPTQGAWQDDLSFEDRPGKQLTRVDDPARIEYTAELPMVQNRDTVLTGVHHYIRGGAKEVIDSRSTIALVFESNCTGYAMLKMKFTLTGAGATPTEFYGWARHYLPVGGPPGPKKVYRFDQGAYSGIPDNPLKFGGTGPYRIEVELVKEDGTPTGLKMSVLGNVVTAKGALVNFVPVLLQSADLQATLESKTRQLSADSAKFIPDFYPLAPGGLPTQVLPTLNVISKDVPGRWFQIRRLMYAAAAVQDELAASTFLTGAGRVIAVLNLGEFGQITTAAGVTPKAEFTPKDSPISLTYKVAFVPRTADLTTVAHELVHTLPPGWSSEGMVAECGLDYHNELESVAHGMRIVWGGQPGERRLKDHSMPIMGPALTHAENMAQPFTFKDDNKKMIKNESGAEESVFHFDMWLSQCTYRHLAGIFSGGPPDPPVILVRGFLHQGEGGKLQGSLNSFYDLMGYSDLQEGAATGWAIVLRNSSGNLMATYPFTPRWTDFHGFYRFEFIPFAYRIPALAGLAQVDLVGPNGVLDSRKVSPEPPKILITSPFDGDSVTPRESRARITWSATGAPEKALLYTVLYSADGGVRWQSREFEITATSAQVLLAAETKQHVVKIIATDGSRSSEAVVRFTTP